MAYLDYFPRAMRTVALAMFSFFEVLTHLAFAAWRFIDLPSGLTMAMDRLARPFSVIPAKSAAARAFISRSLTHDRYIAGHFDPGRMPA